MHADLILVHPNFSSKLMITWRKPTFGPLSNWSKTQFWSRLDRPVRTNEGGPKVSFRTVYHHVIMICSKTQFWSTFNSPNWIKIKFSISLKADQKWVWVTWSLISMRNWGGSKLCWHAYTSRDSPPSHTLLDQNLNPRVLQNYLNFSQSGVSLSRSSEVIK